MYRSLAVDKHVCLGCWSYSFAVFQRFEDLAAAGDAIARYVEKGSVPGEAPDDSARLCSACLGHRSFKLDKVSSVMFLAFVANQPPADQLVEPAEMPANTLEVCVPAHKHFIAHAVDYLIDVQYKHCTLVGPVADW